MIVFNDGKMGIKTEGNNLKKLRCCSTTGSSKFLTPLMTSLFAPASVGEVFDGINGIIFLLLLPTGKF